MTELIKTLIRRGDHTFPEIVEMIKEARERIEDGENPETILHEEFGLEPDYFFDLAYPTKGEFLLDGDLDDE
jgi:hypothetical protein